MLRLGAVLLSLVLLLAASPVWAKPHFSTANLTTPGTERTLILPTPADNSPVISLGTAVDPQSGKLVEGLAIIHYKKAFTHKPNHNPGDKGVKTTACYSFLSNGAKWKAVEPWVVNPANSRGLTDDFVFNNLTANIAKWEDATDGVINGSGLDVLGQGATTSATLVADTSSPDNQNEVYFANVSSPGAIAVTIVWGIFSGPPFARELVEWDQVYDDMDFDWSSSAEAGKMDFENIATHELGHSVGLADLYEQTCAEETMYGYADYGETKKRDLNAGDLTGMNKLY